MTKSLQLQAEMAQEFGACVFDVTLDCEDGAPVGGEIDHSNMVVALANAAHDAPFSIANADRRVGARLHAVDHAAFASDADIVLGGAAAALSYIMVPKVESVADVAHAVAAIDAATPAGSRSSPMPLHVLIESTAAVNWAFDIEDHPRVYSVSLLLMYLLS